jgi:hypothetical protein
VTALIGAQRRIRRDEAGSEKRFSAQPRVASMMIAAMSRPAGLRQDDARWLAERLLSSRNTGDPGRGPGQQSPEDSHSDGGGSLR